MRKIIIVLLAIAMLASVCMFAAGCGEEKTPSETTTTTSKNPENQNESSKSTGDGETTSTSVTTTPPVTTTTSTTTTETSGGEDVNTWNGKSKLPGYEDVDFGGKTFLIASRYDTSGGWSNGREIWVESLTNDAINDAVFERNLVMATLYHCNIMVDSGGWDNGYRADVSAGGGKYIGGCASYAVGSAGADGFANGNYYNVLNLDIDFSQSWWDQAFIRDLSCNGKLYGLSGDFAFYAMSATWILIYNKTIYENNFPDTDIYKLIDDHKWTMDKLLEMCQKVTSDNNGDQQITYSDAANADMIGLITTAHNYRGLYNACGEFYVGKSETGKMICTLGSGKGSDVIDKIRALTTDDSYLEIGYTYVNKAISDGNALFCGQVMGTLADVTGQIEGLRIGVVPQPLYDENQESYYHYVNNQGTFYGIPTSYGDMQTISDFYTLFAAHSQKIVRSAFINTYKYSYTSDEESGEMLDLIINTRTYDPGYHFNMSLGFDGILPSMCGKAGKNQFSSAVKRYVAGVEEAIATYENSISRIEDPV